MVHFLRIFSFVDMSVVTYMKDKIIMFMVGLIIVNLVYRVFKNAVE